jgi:hypothetical protein
MPSARALVAVSPIKINAARQRLKREKIFFIIRLLTFFLLIDIDPVLLYG